MSAVELVIEKVRHLDEEQARQLLAWLGVQENSSTPQSTVASAQAMLGFARRFRPIPRSTADWLSELREGEQS